MTKTGIILESILQAYRNRPLLQKGKKPTKRLRIEFGEELVDEFELRMTINQLEADRDPTSVI